MSEKEAVSTIDLVCLNDINMQPIDWLWADRIALGKLTVLAGNPGLGKSQITAYMAATVTNQLKWPNSNESAPHGHVIFLSAEDDPADTIKPRLKAVGADMRLCHILKAVKETTDKEDITRSFDLSKDIQNLGREVERLKNVKLIVIDPISAYLGDSDGNSNSAIRGLLTPLADLAMNYNLAIVLVTHLNKSKDQDIMGRVIGSIGLIAAARSGYAIIKDEQDPELRYFIPIKNNIGNDKDGFSFKIDSVLLPEFIRTSKITWQPDSVDVQNLLYPEKEQNNSSGNGAKEFLEEILKYGSLSAPEVFSEGDKAGYSKSSLNRAAVKLNVKKRKGSMEKGWTWSLPTSNSHLYKENMKQSSEDTEAFEDDEEYGHV